MIIKNSWGTKITFSESRSLTSKGKFTILKKATRILKYNSIPIQENHKILKNIKKLLMIRKLNNTLQILVKRCKYNHWKEICRNKSKQLWNNKGSY